MRTDLLLSSIYFFSTSVDSFTLETCSPHCLSNTALHLLPSQGCQLAVASATASVEGEHRTEQQHDDVVDKNVGADLFTPTQAARQFVSRVFSLPSYILPHVGIKQPNLLHNFMEPNESFMDDDEGDIVFYPIVGFSYINVDGDMNLLPPPITSGSCNIRSTRMAREDPVYGWFSPCCTLGDLHEDDKIYCGAARKVDDDSASDK